jgi:formylglycine-generating enzyme
MNAWIKKHTLRKNRNSPIRSKQFFAICSCWLIVLLASPLSLQSQKAIAKTIKNPKDGLSYLWIPSGTFTMGCSPGDQQCFSEEMPAHRVTISKGFWIGQTEVTTDAYERFAGLAQNNADPSPQKPSDGNAMPIVVVTWNEASDYCVWAGGRLPTEAEWEYAARGGSNAARYGDLDQIAWYQKNSGNKTHEVAKKQPNSFGLFDVLGNVWEWVSDWYDGTYYAHSSEVDPTGPESGTMHVMRGGSWMNTANLLRLSDRGRSNADLRFNYFGMRCVLTHDAP